MAQSRPDAPTVRGAERRGVHSSRDEALGTAEELVAYLYWQGIAAERAAVSVAAILLATAERTGAGLIVMGAYTHGRMQQIAFGGVTNHVMQNTVLPVLMAHLIGLLRPRQPRRGHQSARRALTAGSVGAQAHNEPMSPVIIPQASLDAWKPHA
jgi:hypothetical protein